MRNRETENFTLAMALKFKMEAEEYLNRLDDDYSLRLAAYSTARCVELFLRYMLITRKEIISTGTSCKRLAGALIELGVEFTPAQKRIFYTSDVWSDLAFYDVDFNETYMNIAGVLGEVYTLINQYEEQHIHESVEQIRKKDRTKVECVSRKECFVRNWRMIS